MGSTGMGRFKDFKPSGNEDRCLEDLENVSLEDVGRMPYYEKFKEMPPMMIEVLVLNDLYNGRIAIQSIDDELIIGLLPSKYNYLLSCLKKGFKYEGHVIFSINNPIPRVMVNLDAFR